jgi:hypothetical protein
MKRTKPKSYEATFRGRKTRVTVPARESVAYCGNPTDVLREVLGDILNPMSAAALANAITVQLKARPWEATVQGQLSWLRDQLTEMVGKDQVWRLCQEAGL